MKRFFCLALFVVLWESLYSQNEPNTNLGKSLETMKKEFPELRYVKTDAKGDEYEDGYPEDGIATFFYFRNNNVIEECLICQSTDGFSKDWFNSMVNSFNRNFRSALKKNTPNEKEYFFSSFIVHLIYVAENGKNTALIIYEKNDLSYQSNNKAYNKTQVQNTTARVNVPTRKLEWYEIGYTENRNDVYGLQPIGSFSATFSPVIFGSRTYDDAFHSAIKKIQKKAAKKGAKRLLITYRSGMNTDFLTVKVEAIGYK